MDWDQAGTVADRKLWRAMFWVGVILLIGAAVNVAFILSDPPRNWWLYLSPAFNVLVGVAMIVYCRRRFRS